MATLTGTSSPGNSSRNKKEQRTERAFRASQHCSQFVGASFENVNTRSLLALFFENVNTRTDRSVNFELVQTLNRSNNF